MPQYGFHSPLWMLQAQNKECEAEIKRLRAALESKGDDSAQQQLLQVRLQDVGI